MVEHRKTRHCVREHRNEAKEEEEKKNGRGEGVNGDGYKKQQLSLDAVTMANGMGTRVRRWLCFLSAAFDAGK